MRQQALGMSLYRNVQVLCESDKGILRKCLLCLCFLIPLLTHGQAPDQRVLFVVDSVAIMTDPGEEESELAESDIETLQVVTDNAEMARHGYREYDKIIFIVTKEYARRPAKLREVPTIRQMEKKNGKWHLKGSTTPYSGPFVEYYLNGKKEGEGILEDGLLQGLRTVYYQNGTTCYYRYYVRGIENGESKEYFQNGKIHQEGVFQNGKEDGLWKQWYSTGVLKRQTTFEEGKAIPEKNDEKFHNLFSKGIQQFNAGNYSGAIKNYDKAIAINPNYSDVYFHRSRAYLYDLHFDQALIDCDKAIELEPMHMEGYSNRAFVRLRKHELKDSRTLSKNSGVLVLAVKDKVDIPQDELEKMCTDLKKGYELGDTKPMIIDALKTYCQ